MSLHRRGFLAAATSLAALGATTGAPVDTPPSRRKPRMLPGCCAYSYGKYFKSGQFTMEQFIDKAADLGTTGVDITTYWLKSTDPEYLIALRNRAYRQGLPLSGLAIRADLCQPAGEKRDATLAEVKKWVDACEWMGASHLRVFGDKLPEGATESQGIEYVADTMKVCCEYSAIKGVIVGIETHVGLTNKGANVIAILKRVNSPFAGCNLDISNFRENPYEQIEACLPYATHAHIRDFYGENPKKPLDLDRVWRLFAQAGYRGFMSAEYEGDEDPMTGVPKLMATIQSLCRKYSVA